MGDRHRCSKNCFELKNVLPHNLRLLLEQLTQSTYITYMLQLVDRVWPHFKPDVIQLCIFLRLYVASRYATTSNPVGLYPIPWEMAQITKRHHDTGLFLSTYNNLPRLPTAPCHSLCCRCNINTKAGEVHDGSRCFVVLATLPLLL